ncbi:uncharacterized protein LOC119735787 [Patiria miniata]|uniref:Uncharacterized protein n=1 Tax=Patiria miniata TaxID=46514 RepID=A0A914APG5_PATMI|nr:uncharacterized protein LOC119735787 [Patiria miniata]XP_038065642.1 uncharacterized protein LOC119735787 [Patiria miniata]
MRHVRAVLMGIATLLTVVSAIDVPVATRYLTTEVTTLAQGEAVTLVGYLCGQAKGDNINVTVVLNNNPTWFVDIGVVYYYVVDSANKTEKDALCTNMYQGKPGPLCVVNSWPSAGDLYIKGKANLVEAVSLTVDAERTRKVGKRNPTVKQSAVEPLPRGLPGQKPMGATDQTIYLTEFITLTAFHTLPRLQEAHLSFNFCPTPAIGSQYTITGTASGREGESTWAQYLCDQLPCDLSHPLNIVAADGKQLPSNTVVTHSSRWTQMYALIVCWGGPYDPKTKAYVGEFQFSAYATKV